MVLQTVGYGQWHSLWLGIKKKKKKKRNVLLLLLP